MPANLQTACFMRMELENKIIEVRKVKERIDSEYGRLLDEIAVLDTAIKALEGAENE